MTRFIAFLALGFFLSLPAQATMPPEMLQNTLNQQLATLKQQMKDRLVTKGDIVVTEQGDKWRVTMPELNVMVVDRKSSWIVPSAVLLLDAKTGADKVPMTATLPATIKQIDLEGNSLREIALTGQKITGSWSLAENTLDSLNAHVDAIKWNDLYEKTSYSVNMIDFKAVKKGTTADTVTLGLDASTGAVKRMPAGSINSIMPQKANVIGEVKNLPKILTVFGVIMPLPGVQAALADAGTYLDLTDIKIKANNYADLTGKGWFKAAPVGAPLAATGRVDLVWKNLEQVMLGLQQRLGETQTNDQAGTTQSIMMLMVLQGLGKTTNQGTEYTLDMTPDGQVLLNGQDVTGLATGNSSLFNMLRPNKKASGTLSSEPLLGGPGR